MWTKEGACLVSFQRTLWFIWQRCCWSALGPSPDIRPWPRPLTTEFHPIPKQTRSSESGLWGDKPPASRQEAGGEIFVTINNSHRVVNYAADGQMLGAWTVGCDNCGVIETNGVAVTTSGWVYVPLGNQPAEQ